MSTSDNVWIDAVNDGGGAMVLGSPDADPPVDASAAVAQSWFVGGNNNFGIDDGTQCRAWMKSNAQVGICHVLQV